MVLTLSMNGRHCTWLVTCSGPQFPQSKEGGWGSVPALTVVEWDVVSCCVLRVKERKAEGQPPATLSVLLPVPLLPTYFIMTLRKWRAGRRGHGNDRLSHYVGFCTVSESSLRVVLQLALANAD